MTTTSGDLSNTPFQVGDWIVDPSSSQLEKNGDAVKIEPKVMQELVYLAEHSGQVVGREELEAAVWSGLVVGYDAVSGSIIKLRKAFGDDSRKPEYKAEAERIAAECASQHGCKNRFNRNRPRYALPVAIPLPCTGHALCKHRHQPGLDYWIGRVAAANEPR